MKAITVEPRQPGSACLEDISEPDARDGSVLVEAVAVGPDPDRPDMVEEVRRVRRFPTLGLQGIRVTVDGGGGR